MFTGNLREPWAFAAFPSYHIDDRDMAACHCLAVEPSKQDTDTVVLLSIRR